ncbi:uncharacterized protein [Rutidosis leptorrhynchoides]|uniref:uncharacterized protein n=1 Tax=Rutidosis leptorrhynchoides TaxID=125765 RepID=UPI003A99230E
MIKWKKTIAHKDCGGLATGSLKAKNVRLLSKWWWRVKQEPDALWHKIIVFIYGDNGSLSQAGYSSIHASMWKGIVKADLDCEKARVPFIKSIKRKLGRGDSISFWYDHWGLSRSGIFTVTSLSSLLDKRLLGADLELNCVKWVPCIPKKVNIFAWRMNNNGLPARVNMERRGMQLESKLCLFCHFFDWWGLTDSLPIGVSNAVSSANFQVGSKLLNKVCLAAKYVLLWAIWHWRNKLINGLPEQRNLILKEDILARVKSLSHLWIFSRLPKIGIKMEDWINNPSQKENSIKTLYLEL